VKIVHWGYWFGITETEHQRYSLFIRQMITAVTVKSRFSPMLVHNGFVVNKSGSGTGFSPSISVFPCQYHSTNASYSSATQWNLDLMSLKGPFKVNVKSQKFYAPDISCILNHFNSSMVPVEYLRGCGWGVGGIWYSSVNAHARAHTHTKVKWGFHCKKVRQEIQLPWIFREL
jgi:hypothetical protein